MMGFLKKHEGKSKRSKLEMFLEAIRRGNLFIAINPEDYYVLGLFEYCIPRKDLEYILDEKITDMERAERIIKYVSGLPAKIDCRIEIELSPQNKVYIPITISKEKIIRNIIHILETPIHVVNSVVDAIWRFFLEEIDKMIIDYTSTKPTQSIEESQLQVNMSSTSMLKLFKVQFKGEMKTVNIYTSEGVRNIVYGLILGEARNILEGLCHDSLRLFEEKARSFENDIRTYAIKLYGIENTEAINTAIQHYREIVSNIKTMCVKDENKSLDKLYEIIGEAKKSH